MMKSWSIINTLVTAGPDPEKSTNPVSWKAPIAWGIRFRILLPGLTFVQEKFGGKFKTCFEKTSLGQSEQES